MLLQPKQSMFARKIALLILYADKQGYELTFGSAYIPERLIQHTLHKENTLHKKRLAIDLNLFKDGVWLNKTKHHKQLGEYWESIGGAWGGRFGDGNHYSLEHEGMR